MASLVVELVHHLTDLVFYSLATVLYRYCSPLGSAVRVQTALPILTEANGSP